MKRNPAGSAAVTAARRIAPPVPPTLARSNFDQARIPSSMKAKAQIPFRRKSCQKDQAATAGLSIPQLGQVFSSLLKTKEHLLQ
jgi:hypothetical protein